MIAKIGRSNNLFGVLSYNNTKIQKEKGEILLTNNMIETLNGQYSVPQLIKSFEPYLIANQKLKSIHCIFLLIPIRETMSLIKNTKK